MSRLKTALLATCLTLASSPALAAGKGDLLTPVVTPQPAQPADQLKADIRAAKQGDAAAQYRLGRAYLLGEGLPQSYEKALLWFDLSAKQNNPDALSHLGLAYLMGQGVPRHKGRAFEFYRQAAELGHAGAQSLIALMYLQGDGVNFSQIRAYLWFHIAADNGHPNAGKNRDIIAQKMTPDQIIEAQKLAQQWLDKQP